MHIYFLWKEGNALDEWFKKYPELVYRAKGSTLVLDGNIDFSKITKEYRLVVADYATYRFTNPNVLEVAQSLHRIVAENGYLIIRLKSMRDPQYLGAKKLKANRGLVTTKSGSTERYFDETQIDEFFSPFFRIDTLSEELLDEKERNSFVYTGYFRKK